MLEIPVRKPSPDFDAMKKIIKGEQEAARVPLVELLVDEEVKRVIIEQGFGEEWVTPPRLLFGTAPTGQTPREGAEEAYWRQNINFFYRLGYDVIPDMEHILRWQGLLTPKRVRDTAALSRGDRSWALEGKGMITSWEDFEQFPWGKAEKITRDLEKYYHFLGKNLPEGMKLAVIESLHEQVLEFLLGYQGLLYLVHDDPDLVGAIFERWGSIVYDFYRQVAPLDIVGVIWHGDDLGFKTSTLLSPEHLRRWVFPWFKKYASLAHAQDKMYWYHCCGYKQHIMEDLIENVGIDALHSFEDVCCPVTEYKQKYGKQIAVLGGVDVDKLCRLDEKALREYVRTILDQCMPQGRYALGSGNSITNYVPVKNYLIMLDEGCRWPSRA